ncbi:MAG TPA: hypothetical protein EYP14_10075, partial [Planctomycetaceae bacterium]|nr:hypothetical protein [Planctomycetaceae bacterium]
MEALWQERLQALRVAAGHLEYLLRQRALNPLEANAVASAILGDVYVPSASAQRAREMWPHVCALRREVFWRYYPLFPRLDPGIANGTVRAMVRRIPPEGHGKRHSAARQYDVWTRAACQHVFIPVAFPSVTRPPLETLQKQALDDLFRFVTEVTPEVPLAGLNALMVRPYVPSIPASIIEGRLTVGLVQRFYERLKQTGRPGHRWQARLGTLALRVHGLAGSTDENQITRELEALAAEVDAWQADTPLAQRAKRNMTYHIRWLKEQMARPRREVGQPKRHDLPPNPIPESEADWQVRFEPTDLSPVEWYGLRQCTQAMDVAWDESTVWVLEGRSKMSVVLRRQKSGVHGKDFDAILMPAWDGENLWIACRHSGIHVVSPSGAIVARIGRSEGLPPY